MKGRNTMYYKMNNKVFLLVNKQDKFSQRLQRDRKTKEIVHTEQYIKNRKTG
jgi:hypothetical protein